MAYSTAFGLLFIHHPICSLRSPSPQHTILLSSTLPSIVLAFLTKPIQHVTCAYLYYLEYKLHEEKTLLYSLLIPQGLEVYPAHAVPSIFVLM